MSVSSHRTSERHRVSLCFVSLFVRCDPPPPPAHPEPPHTQNLFVEQRDLAVVTVVAAHLAVSRIQAGGVGEGGRQGVIVRGGVGVARWGQQGLGVRLG